MNTDTAGKEVLTNLTHNEKLELLAEVLRSETKERLEKDSLNTNGCNEPCTRVVIGKKYVKIDIGRHQGQWSGAYMVDSDGNIFGIKAYGVINRGHQFGTLDTIHDYFWGNYRAVKK